MKKREEMIMDLHRRMDEYESERRMKRAKMTKVAASVTPVCAAAVVGVGLWKGGALTPHNDQLIASTVESTASVPASDNNTNTNTESQRATEAPAKQTEAPVQQTVPNNGGHFMWFIVGSTIELNGFTYYDNDMANVSAYTRDRYIGKVGDFEGIYGGADVHSSYRIAPEDSVYAVKGTNDVLLVVKADSNSPYGAIIVMSNSNWSLEKYEPERLDPNYVDPNASSQVIF